MSAFEGFIPPSKNYFPMPNNWTDICAEINNLAELKVVQYVMRHTWGYKEYGIKKVITTDEFMNGRKRNDGSRMDKGTGLSNRSVIDGLRAAIDHGYLVCELDETDKARKVKSYALKMVESDVKILHSETAESDVKILHSRREESSHHAEDASHQREGSSYRSEKDTIETHLQKNTSEKQISPKWIVSKAEELRERTYTDNQRPKELKAAEKLLQRKPDLAFEEFEQAFTKRNDAWWREHVGLLNVTDLAATPKDKNDIRLMLMLEQIEREKNKPALQVVASNSSKYVEPNTYKPQKVADVIKSRDEERARRRAAMNGVNAS